MKFTGLTEKEVEQSRQKNGSNVIPDSEPTTFWQEFRESFNDSLNSCQKVVGSESGITFEPFFCLDCSTSFSVKPVNFI